MSIKKEEIEQHEMAERCNQAADWLFELYFNKKFDFSPDDVEKEILYLRALHTKYSIEKINVYESIARYSWHYIQCLDANKSISEWWDQQLRKALTAWDAIKRADEK